MTAAKRVKAKGLFRPPSSALRTYFLPLGCSTKRIGKESTKSKLIEVDHPTGARPWNIKRTVSAPDTCCGLARCDSLPHTIKLPALSPGSLPKGATLFEWEKAYRYHPFLEMGL